MEPQITVVVPTLNSAKTLAFTLLSLLSQEDCPVRVIVVDSGSSDATQAICAQYGVEVLYEPPGSMYRAINRGLERAETDWVSYLNSDDLVYGHSYRRLIDLGNRDGSDIVYGACDFVDAEGRFLHSYLPGRPSELRTQFLNSQLSFGQPAAVFRGAVFADLGGFDAQYKFAADLDFFLRALLAGKRFSMLPGLSVAAFRVHSSQLSASVAQHVAETRLIQARHGAHGSRTSPDVVRWRLRNLPNYALRLLRHFVLTGKVRRVRTLEGS